MTDQIGWSSSPARDVSASDVFDSDAFIVIYQTGGGESLMFVNKAYHRFSTGGKVLLPTLFLTRCGIPVKIPENAG
jgi:hypothetical protein